MRSIIIDASSTLEYGLLALFIAIAIIGGATNLEAVITSLFNGFVPIIASLAS